MVVVAVGAFRGRWLSFEGACVGCVVLLSLLGGRGRLWGGCRPSWAAGVVCGGRACVKWHEMLWEGRCASSLGAVLWWPALLVCGGCWLKKPCHNV